MANKGEDKADHKSSDYKNLENDLNELYLKGPILSSKYFSRELIDRLLCSCRRRWIRRGNSLKTQSFNRIFKTK
jgi:hypothetical protein